MTTVKKSTRNSSSPRPLGIQAQAQHVSKRLGNSAQQVWLAGLGVLGRAQSESSRVFDSLVKEGAAVEHNGRKRAEAGVKAVRERLGNRYSRTRQRFSGSLEQLENTIDARVKNVLHSLHIPDRAEVQALREQVDTLKAQLRANKTKSRRRPGPRRPEAPISESPQPIPADTISPDNSAI